jgi:hypothetical protein
MTHDVVVPSGVVQDRTSVPARATAVAERISAPFEVGDAHETVICEELTVATTAAGLPGSPAGVATIPDDSSLVPMAFVAFTVKVYDVPLVSPLTTQVSADDEMHCAEPGLERTVYPVMTEAPSESGADHATVTEPLAGMILEIMGAVGRADVNVTARVALEVGPQLILPGRRACTVNEYEVRARRPTMVQLSEVVVHVNPPGLEVRTYTRPSLAAKPAGITQPIVADP